MGRITGVKATSANFETMTPEAAEAAKNRRVNGRRGMMSRTATYGGGGAGGAAGGFSDIQFATGRPRDPLFYWRQNNLPYDFSQNEELAKVRAFTRLLYQTDPIIGSCVDIFSRFPVIGHEIVCKDDRLTDFYGSLFYDEDHLDYEEFLEDIGREYYITGEAWPFATFNEDLGIWDDEELLNPDDIKVERSPFLKEPQYFIRLPWVIRQVLQSREPAWQYKKLIEEYPELAAYTSENSFMPVSGILMNFLKFKGDTFNVRGLPLLTRAMRPMLQQEMLNTAMDAIADRLYTPLVLCKLGASASDLGTSQPWIPTEDDLLNFEMALDSALAGDFRALIYNFAIEMVPVFGREQMPDLTPDFERIEDRILQVFGMSKTLLTGAQEGQTYAADALNKELVTQLMGRQQKRLRAHWRKRCKVIAEAQEHYDYNEHGGKRYVIMEEVLEEDEETGEKHIVEQPKLLIPDLTFLTLNLRDRDTERQFVEALRAGGIPISQKTRLKGLDIDLEQEEEISADEMVRQATAEQMARKRTYTALRDQGLPIAQDLVDDFTPKAQIAGPGTFAGSPPPLPVPRLGVDEIAPHPNLASSPEDEGAEQAEEEEDEGNAPPEGEDDDMEERPEESDEMREGMPKKSVRRYGPRPDDAKLFRRTASTRHLASEVVREPIEPEVHHEQVRKEGELTDSTWESFGAPDAWRDPLVVGTRRYASVDPDRPMDEELYAPGKL